MIGFLRTLVLLSFFLVFSSLPELDILTSRPNILLPKFCTGESCTLTEIRMIQRGLAWPSRRDDMYNHEAFYPFMDFVHLVS